jgi:hypothetical protein
MTELLTQENIIIIVVGLVVGFLLSLLSNKRKN